MLEIGIHKVTKNYGFSQILDGASLEIMSGDRVAIVGRNGTGKSTILKIIAGQEGINSGLVTIRKGASIGYLEQIPQLFSRDTVTRDVLMEPFEAIRQMEKRLRDLEARMSTEAEPEALDRLMHQYAFQQSAFEAQDGYAVEEQVARVATGFGLTALLDRPFNVLSGGQKTIVMLAQTILRKPDILLLDEPTNHLDMRTLEWFEDYLTKYAGTVLIVSHDRYFLDKVAKKTVILEAGVCQLYHGNYTQSQEERERQLLAEFEQFKNQQKKIDAMKAAIRRFRDWGTQADNKSMFVKAKQLEKRLENMEMLGKPQLEKAKIPIQFASSRTGREVLRMRDFDLTAGSVTLLREAEMLLLYRDKACLIGDNGSGKTTLVRAILERTGEPDGTLYITERAKIGYIPQEIRFPDDNASILQTFRMEHPCAEGTARNILAKYFFVGEHVHKRVSALSGGEKVLLKLAILVQQEVNCLILDEPTNHIDIETREMLEEALVEYTGTLLFVSHDRYFIQKIASRIIAIEDLRLHDYAGDYEYYKQQRAQ